MKPKGMPLMLAVALAATVLAGCTASDEPGDLPEDRGLTESGGAGQDAGSSGESSLPAEPNGPIGTWYYWPGIQCEPTPWEQAKEQYGIDEKSHPDADEPFEQSTYQEALISAYLDDAGHAYEQVVSYYDDMAYASVCGGASGDHHWVRAETRPPGDGWYHESDGPPHDYHANDES